MQSNHGDLTRCSATALRKAARRVTQLYDESLAPAGLTVTQFALLTALARDEPKCPTVTELADIMVMDRSGLGHTLRPLQRDGYISLVQNKDDRRERGVALTPRGRTTRKKAAVFWESAQKRFVEVVGRDVAPRLQSILLSIAHEDRLSTSTD